MANWWHAYNRVFCWKYWGINEKQLFTSITKKMLKKMVRGKEISVNVRTFRFEILKLLRNYVRFQQFPGIILIKSILPTFLETGNVAVILHSYWTWRILCPSPVHLSQNHAIFLCTRPQSLCLLWIMLLTNKEKVSRKILDGFMKRHHVMCHQSGLWNGTWSDMMIGTT